MIKIIYKIQWRMQTFREGGGGGGGGAGVMGSHSDPEKRGGRLPQNFGPHFVITIRRGPAHPPPPPAPLLDPPLKTEIIYNLVKLREF